MNLTMTTDRLDISRLKDAVIIRYYINPDSELGLIVIDSENRVVNLTERDPYFRDLEQSAARAFTEAPDSPADSFTLEILENHSSPVTESALKRICAGEEQMISGMKESSRTATHRKLIAYCLELLYTRLGAQFGSFIGIEGYRKRYSAAVTVNSVKRVVPFSCSDNSRHSEYLFGNILPSADNAAVTVRYYYGGADILIRCGVLTISDCYVFNFCY